MFRILHVKTKNYITIIPHTFSSLDKTIQAFSKTNVIKEVQRPTVTILFYFKLLYLIKNYNIDSDEKVIIFLNSNRCWLTGEIIPYKFYLHNNKLVVLK
jgi:hypothetical protein